MSIVNSSRAGNGVRDPFQAKAKEKKPAKPAQETRVVLLGEHSRYQIKSG